MTGINFFSEETLTGIDAKSSTAFYRDHDWNSITIYSSILSVMILKVIFHECILHTYSAKVLFRKKLTHISKQFD